MWVRSDFQMLVNALQDRYTKKARDQQAAFEADLKSMVTQTVDTLSSKVGDYESHLYFKIDTSPSQRSFLELLD
jgi:hypothetical protein